MTLLRCALASGLPDGQAVKARVFSLWVMLEAAGGYLGSTLGGAAFDSLGFEWASVVEAAVMAATVLVLLLYVLVNRTRSLTI